VHHRSRRATRRGAAAFWPGRLVAAAALASAAGACGYAVVRAVPPAGVERIAVGTFGVRAGPPVLGAWIAEAVATELAATPGVSLAGVDRADAVVQGEVRLAGDAAVALASGAAGPRAAVAEVQLEVGAALVGRGGAELRATAPLRLRALRTVAEAGAADQAHETRALRAAAAAAGRALVRALLDDGS
jgi:hypothetical protein